MAEAVTQYMNLYTERIETPQSILIDGYNRLMKRFHVTKRFVRYQVVSFSSFLIDLCVLSFCIFVLDINYLLATAIGFLASVVYAFFINRMWSFQKWVLTGRIIVSVFVGLGTLAVVLFVTFVGVQAIRVPYLEARLAAALIAAIVSYIGDSIFTFEIQPFE